MLETRDQGGDSPPARLGRGGGVGTGLDSGVAPARAPLPALPGLCTPFPGGPAAGWAGSPLLSRWRSRVVLQGSANWGVDPSSASPSRTPESPWSLCWFASSPVVREWGGNVTAPGTSVPGESYLHPRETEPSAGTAGQRRGRLHPHSCCLGKSWRPRPGGQPPARPWTAVVCCGHGGCGGGPVACGQAAGVTVASACL